MAENKQYITQTQENGVVMISEEVVATIVSHCVMEVEGVVGIGNKAGAERKLWNKGMKIAITETNDVTIDCNVVIAYGCAVVTVAKAVQDAIATSVESMTGVKPVAININVIGIVRQ